MILIRCHQKDSKKYWNGRWLEYFRYKPKLSRKKMLEECDVYVYDVASAT